MHCILMLDEETVKYVCMFTPGHHNTERSYNIRKAKGAFKIWLHLRTALTDQVCIGVEMSSFKKSCVFPFAT
jgi:hypothetical protein